MPLSSVQLKKENKERKNYQTLKMRSKRKSVTCAEHPTIETQYIQMDICNIRLKLLQGICNDKSQWNKISNDYPYSFKTAMF